MRLKDLVVVLTIPLYLCGCVVVYRSLDTATSETAGGGWKSDRCQISYAVIHSKSDTTPFPPSVDDYEKWISATVSALGCNPIQIASDKKPDLSIRIIEFPLPYEYGQGERWLSFFTLAVIPIPLEGTMVREYTYALGDRPARTVRVAQKGWLGWIFIPLFPFIAWSYPEERIFKTQLTEYLSEK